jgi:thiosulfate/3-mercaptopyruvate sulfurtransferase
MNPKEKGYANPRFLISPEELLGLLGSEDLVVIDTRPLEDYLKAHLPGARCLDVFEHKLASSEPEALEEFERTMEELFRQAGVGDDSMVVVYDDISGMRAARGLFLLEYLGLEQARLLDGGLNAWKKARGPLSQEETRVPRGGFRARPKRHLVATWRDVLDALGREDVLVLDVRRLQEFSGEEVRASRAGHIPGALHIEWKEALDSQGAFLPAEKLRALYEARGVEPEKEIIPYCHGGYRSSHTWLALTLLGFGRVRNYLSSWAEWADRPDTPVAGPSES